MLIRRERPGDIDAIREITTAAFAPSAVEAPLVDQLRADPGWIPRLSLVAVEGDTVIGHVVCTRGWIDAVPALGLGPLSVAPSHQRIGVGNALMHAVLGAADALDEAAVLLLGNPAYYSRFGFGPASAADISAPDPTWGAAFQVRTLTAYDGTQRGPFTYAAPFSGL